MNRKTSKSKPETNSEAAARLADYRGGQLLVGGTVPGASGGAVGGGSSSPGSPDAEGATVSPSTSPGAAHNIHELSLGMEELMAPVACGRDSSRDIVQKVGR